MMIPVGILAVLLGAQAAPARLANLDQHDLQLAMARLAAEHPDLVTVVPVGESRAKTRIEALRLPAREPEHGRPALLIVADVDGPLVWTSSLALDHARQLAERYASDAQVKELLDTTTVYVIPRADPDAAQARFAKPLYEERASGPGVDDDRDGRQGEDPPRDVDGDGLVTWMRVPDPEGEWTTDPADERALVKADRARGQRGRWKLMREGRDADGDGVAAEDQDLDAVVNRNFPAGFEEHGHDSGRFPTDEPEARALCEFVLQHKEIALVVTYGTIDDVVEKPRAEGKPKRESIKPSAGIPEADVALYAEIGRRFQKQGRGTKGDGQDGGTFQAWVQAQRGLWAVDIAPWSIPLDEAAPKKPGEADTQPDAQPKSDTQRSSDTEHKADTAPKASADPKTGGGSKPDAGPKSDLDKKTEAAPKQDAKSDGKPTAKAGQKDDDKPAPSDDAKRLRWIDAKNESARFIGWHAFQHPELGAVEIGGFAPYALVEPPDAEREEIANKNLEFVIGLGRDLARLELVGVTAKDLGNGLWDVKASLVDDGLLPYPSALGRRTGQIRPARVTVEPKELQLLEGERQVLVRDLEGSGGRRKLHWLARGVPPSGMRIVLDTDNAGASSVVPEVK